jgi:hypothetical protein
VKGWIALGLAMVILALGGWALFVEPAVLQPIEFPHKAHLQLKDPRFECTTCHDLAEKGRAAGRPSTKKCLSCHSAGTAKGAEEQKLRALAQGGEIPWQRVWRLPPHVFFSHRTHVAVARIRCQTCHGPMETLTRPPRRPLKTLAMQDCLGCHEAWRWPDETAPQRLEAPRAAAVRRVSTDCNACHR